MKEKILITGSEGKLGEQVLHLEANPEIIKTTDPIRPNSDYASAKAFMEAIAREYYEIYGISSICLRVGTVREDDNPIEETKRWLKTWLSHRDLIQLIEKSLISKIGFGIYYGVSDNTNMFWDISNAKKDLNYHPVDDGLKICNKIP